MFNKLKPSTAAIPINNLLTESKPTKIFPELGKNNNLDFDYVLKVFKVNFEKNKSKFLFTKEEKNELKSSLEFKSNSTTNSNKKKPSIHRYRVFRNVTRSISNDEHDMVLTGFSNNKKEIKETEGISKILYKEINKQEMKIKVDRIKGKNPFEPQSQQLNIRYLTNLAEKNSDKNNPNHLRTHSMDSQIINLTSNKLNSINITKNQNNLYKSADFNLTSRSRDNSSPENNKSKLMPLPSILEGKPF